MVTLVRFSKNIQISIIKVVVEGNRFVIRWDWMERDALTGAPHFSNDMLCGELDPTGKILFKREYFDVYRQFELTPVFPPSPSDRKGVLMLKLFPSGLSRSGSWP